MISNEENSETENTPNDKEFQMLSELVHGDLQKIRKLAGMLSKKELQRLVISMAEHPVESSVDMKTSMGKTAKLLGTQLKQNIFHMTLKYLQSEEQTNEPLEEQGVQEND